MQNNIFSPEIIGCTELHAHKHIYNDAAKPVHITIGNEINGFGWYITINDKNDALFRIRRANLSNTYKYRDKFLTKQGDFNDK